MIKGKGLSVIDVMTGGAHRKTREITMSVEADKYYPNHVGIDFYHRYKEDIALFKRNGITMPSDVNRLDTYFSER